MSRIRLALVASLALTTLAFGVYLFGCQSTVTSPFSGQPVTREQLAAEKATAEAVRRADTAEAAAAEQLKKDQTTREARLQLGNLQRVSTAQIEDADAAHAGKVREIRTTTENAIAQINAKVEDVHSAADARIATAGRVFEADLTRINGSFDAATAALDRKDAVRAAVLGGLDRVGTPIVQSVAAGAGPAGGILSSIWSLVIGGAVAGTAVGGVGYAKVKSAQATAAAAQVQADEHAERADEAATKADVTKLLAERAIDAIEVAKTASPEFARAWAAVKPVITEYAGEDATKFVHDLKEFGHTA